MGGIYIGEVEWRCNGSFLTSIIVCMLLIVFRSFCLFVVILVVLRALTHSSPHLFASQIILADFHSSL